MSLISAQEARRAGLGQGAEVVMETAGEVAKSAAKSAATSAATGAISGAARWAAVVAIPWVIERFRRRKKGAKRRRK